MVFVSNGFGFGSKCNEFFCLENIQMSNAADAESLLRWLEIPIPAAQRFLRSNSQLILAKWSPFLILYKQCFAYPAKYQSSFPGFIYLLYSFICFSVDKFRVPFHLKKQRDRLPAQATISKSNQLGGGSKSCNKTHKFSQFHDTSKCLLESIFQATISKLDSFKEGLRTVIKPK